MLEYWRIYRQAFPGARAGSGYIGKAPRAHPVRPRRSCNGATAPPCKTVRLTPHSRQYDSLIRVVFGSQGHYP